MHVGASKSEEGRSAIETLQTTFLQFCSLSLLLAFRSTLGFGPALSCLETCWARVPLGERVAARQVFCGLARMGIAPKVLVVEDGAVVPVLLNDVERPDAGAVYDQAAHFIAAFDPFTGR